MKEVIVVYWTDNGSVNMKIFGREKEEEAQKYFDEIQWYDHKNIQVREVE